MSTFILIQIAFNIAAVLVGWVLWTKLRKPPKDDPRLSRGLQLLQSKISVLEDLSDKTDQQVKQIIAVLDRKCRELQNKVQDASSEIQRVEHSIHRSKEVSEIFEDRIPHSEIIERQKTKSYVMAAQMAHKGETVENIVEQVDLPRSEIELITKVNKDRLMFSQEHLPEWASSAAGIEYQLSGADFVEKSADDSVVFKPLIEQPKSLERIGEEFRRACDDAQLEQEAMEVESNVEQMIQQFGQSAVNRIRTFSEDTKSAVQQVKEDLGEAISRQSVEVIRKNSDPRAKKVTERAQVDSSSVKRVMFPSVGDVGELS